MEKAAKILNLIGYIIEILGAIFLLFMFVIGVIIAMPMSADIIRDGIKNGTISKISTMTLEENVQYIQKVFIIFSVVMFFVAAIYVTCSVFAVIIAKRSQERKFVITTLVLASLSVNILLVIACAFMLTGDNIETINVS